MTRAWLAVVDGELRTWVQRAKPSREALRVDSRLVDPEGAPATVSIVLLPAGRRVLFDDLEVQQARRRVLAGPSFDAVSTLLRDSSHLAGAVTVARGAEQVARLAEGPFARISPAVVLAVGPGVVGRIPHPAGPTIERYGSAQPWPWDRFPTGT